MDGVEVIFLLANTASKIYDNLCQVQTNREEVTSLQLRISLLINCLNAPETVGAHGQGVIAGMQTCLEKAERLADDFAAKAGDRLHQFVWSASYAQRCAAINRDLSGFVQLLGVASDRQQLECLNEIQSQMEDRRQHDLGVGEQLRLLRQAVMECQRLHYDRKQTARSLQKIRETLVNTASTAAMSTVSEDDDPMASSLTAADLEGLPSHVRELFLRAEYRSCLLDSRLLEFEESADDPSGSFGVVHKGTYLGKPIAAKVLLNKDPTTQAVKELLDETLLLKKFNFDCFATVYGVCVVDAREDGGPSGKKSPAVVMKRMDSDLFRFLHRSDREDLKQSLPWKLKSAIAIAAAVEALHGLQILHRDLKSLNILVGGADAGEICIADFGMARMRREATSLRNSKTLEAGQHETIGSYPWMAPEIMKAGKYTDKADVFSLGVILWEIFTWEEPWAEAASLRAIENAVCSGSLLDTDGVPPGLVSLLHKMWKASPHDRPSAKEVVAELTAFEKKHVGGSASPTRSLSSAVPPLVLNENPPQDDLEAGPSSPEPINAGNSTSEPSTCEFKMTKRRGIILAVTLLVLAVVVAVGAVVANANSSSTVGSFWNISSAANGTTLAPAISPIPAPIDPPGPGKSCDTNSDCKLGVCAYGAYSAGSRLECCGSGVSKEIWRYQSDDFPKSTTSKFCTGQSAGSRCPRDPEAGGNDLCESNVCVMGTCADGLQTDEESCDEDSDCLSTKCGTQTCVSGETGDSCDTDSDCSSNVCISGSCSSERAGAGERCDTNSDCQLGVCAYGAYIAGSKLECCGSGVSKEIWRYQSDDFPKSTTSEFCTGQSAGSRCPRDLEAGGNDLCESNVCVMGTCADGLQADGESCDEDSDCLSTKCGTQTCVSGQAGDSCDSDSDCSSNVCISGSCSSERAGAGERCDTNSDCQLGVCAYGAYIAGSRLECCGSGVSKEIWRYQSDDFPKSTTSEFCTGQSAGSRCPSDLEAEGNDLCESNVCVMGTCADGLQADGESCDEDSDCLSTKCGTQTCVPGETGDSCDTDSDCLSNVCISGSCSSERAGAGERCDTNSDCQLGVCAYGAYIAGSRLECCGSGESMEIWRYQSDDFPKSTTSKFCTGQSAGSRCPKDLETGGNDLCESNVCVLGTCADGLQADGESCDSDADCLSNVCATRTCVSGQIL